MMTDFPIMSIGQIANRADFIGHFGAFLNYEAGVGLMPRGISGSGFIMWDTFDRKPPRLDPLISIDGSPRRKVIGGVHIPELHEDAKPRGNSHWVRASQKQ